MRPVQIVLLASVTLFVIYPLRFRSRGRDAVVLLILAFLSFTFIVFPDATTVLANALGVGRGTDLLVYINWCLVVFLGSVFHRRLLQQDREISALIRENAMRNAKDLGDK